jgi:hypothetical protein
MAFGLQERPEAARSWRQGEEERPERVPELLRWVLALVLVQEPPPSVWVWFRCDTRLHKPSLLFPWPDCLPCLRAIPQCRPLPSFARLSAPLGWELLRWVLALVRERLPLAQLRRDMRLRMIFRLCP